MHKDLFSSAALLAVAGAYYIASSRILDTSLSDEVGARGLPTVLAALLALLALGIGFRALALSPAGRRASTPPVADDEPEAAPLRALGLLVIGALYIPIAWIAGYIPAIALLLIMVALYEGARFSWRVIAIAVMGAAFFWLLFIVLLGVSQPQGFY